MGTVDRRSAPGGRDVRRPGCRPGCSTLLAEHDDALLAAYVEDGGRPLRRLRAALAAQTGGRGAPGVLRLGDHRRRRRRADRPASPSCCRRRPATPDGPLSGTVFKVERGPAGEKIAYVADVLRHGADPRPGARWPAGGRGEGHRRSACSTAAARPRRRGRRRRARSASSGACADVRIGDADRRRRARPAAGRPVRAADAGDRRRARPARATGARCTPRSPSSPSRTR